MKRIVNFLMIAASIGLPAGVLTSTTGCAGSTYERSTGEYIDDKTVVSRVKDALGDNPEFKFKDVNVASFKGTVQLSGFVNTTEQEKKAGEIAEKVQGVKDVQNNITAKEKL